jgi:lysophospholipase L1-like esterase
MLGSKPWFSSRGWRVDAQVGRQFSAGVPILRSYARSGSMPRNVVVSLGTNGTVSPSDCRSMVNAAGPARRVFLVNNHADRSWIAGNNRAIRACAAAFARNRVIVVDWATPAGAHPGWFGSDGIHPNSTGRRNYTGLVGAALARSGL